MNCAALGFSETAAANPQNADSLEKRSEINFIEANLVYLGLPERPKSYSDNFVKYVKSVDDPNSPSIILPDRAEKRYGRSFRRNSVSISSNEGIKFRNRENPGPINFVSRGGDETANITNHLPKRTGIDSTVVEYTPVKNKTKLPEAEVSIQNKNFVKMRTSDGVEKINVSESKTIKLDQESIDINVPSDEIQEIPARRDKNPNNTIKVRRAKTKSFDVRPVIKLRNHGNVDVYSPSRSQK